MLHSVVTPKTLGFVRVVVFGLWLLIVFAAPLSELSKLPHDMFTPIGFVRLLPAGAIEYVLHPLFLHSFKWILMVGLLLSLLGSRPFRMVAISTVLILTF